MRILSVSPNFSQNANVNFGRFADKNARKVVRKALTAKPDQDYMQPVYDSWFKKIDKCNYFEAYTSNNGTVKGRFVDEFVRSADGKKAKFDIDWLKEQGALEDLSEFGNIDNVVSAIDDIDDVLKGINPADKWLSDKPHGDSRAEEAERQARIDNLAD